MAIWHLASAPMTAILSPGVVAPCSPVSIDSTAFCFHASISSCFGRDSPSIRCFSSTSRHNALPARRSSSPRRGESAGIWETIDNNRLGSLASVAAAIAITAASMLSLSSGQVRMISSATSAHCRLAPVFQTSSALSFESCCQQAIDILAACLLPGEFG